MPDLKTAPRKKVPKRLAVIDADNCTGCEACIEVCPVDCIEKVHPCAEAPGLQAWCEIDWDRCIGCELCVRLPTKKADRYELLVCPWEAIRMVPTDEIVEAVDRMGGLPKYLAEHRERLLETARRQVESARRR
jgi:electron transport complex protein RnfB